MLLPVGNPGTTPTVTFDQTNRDDVSSSSLLFILIVRARTIQTKAFHKNKRIFRVVLQLLCMCVVCKSDEF